MRTFSSSGKRAQRTTDNCCSKEKRSALFFKHTEWNDIVCQPSMWLIFSSFARAHSGNICYHSIHAKLWNMIQKMDISTICHDDVVCCNNGPSFSRSPFLFLRSLWQNKYLSRTSKSLRTATRIAIIRADSICIDSPHWNNDILFKKKTNLVHISNVVSIFNLNSIQWFCVEHACCSFFFSSSSHFFLQKKTLFAFNIFSMWLLQSLFMQNYQPQKDFCYRNLVRTFLWIFLQLYFRSIRYRITWFTGTTNYVSSRLFRKTKKNMFYWVEFQIHLLLAFKQIGIVTCDECARE